jgi:hypothetical protein
MEAASVTQQSSQERRDYGAIEIEHRQRGGVCESKPRGPGMP